MTPQKAIERLRKIPVRPKPNNVLDLQAIAIAINALKKQIPKKVKNKTFSSENQINYGKCPNCNNMVNDVLDITICTNVKCGQALDWSDEE